MIATIRRLARKYGAYILAAAGMIALAWHGFMQYRHSVKRQDAGLKQAEAQAQGAADKARKEREKINHESREIERERQEVEQRIKKIQEASNVDPVAKVWADFRSNRNRGVRDD